jgi:hypothetical protein
MELLFLAVTISVTLDMELDFLDKAQTQFEYRRLT